MVNRQRDLLRLRIQLDGILPPIWRKILVPARYSFWDLHVAIQDAMGWWDSHLHEFRIPDRQSGEVLVAGIPMEDGFEDLPGVEPGWEISVTDYLCLPGDTIEYEYDFGDSWVHEVTLEAIESRIKGQKYPQCSAGERACPPEDCGGVPGYYALVEALLDPNHDEYESYGDWIPEGWGPELFRSADVRFQNPTSRWKQVFSNDD